MTRALLLCLALSVTGCASMIDEHRRIADWPELTVKDHVVSFAEVVRVCSKYTNFLTWPPVACAEIYFADRTCHIYRMEDADALVMEHEMLHCQGGQHIGDNTLEQAWLAYKQTIPGRAVAEGLRK